MLLPCCWPINRLLNSSTVSSAAPIGTETFETVILNLLGAPPGLSLKEGALGLGLFLALPPM